MSFVPISLLVTLEMVRYAQAIFISCDISLYYEPLDMPAGVQSSNLNEELGQINYVFSDKTGTLTCNIMEFRKVSINGKSFGTNEHVNIQEKQPNVDFIDSSFNPTEKHATDFLILLACCHTIIIQHNTKGIEYNSSSPDELALVNAARYFGVEFIDRDENNIKIKIQNKVISIKILTVIEFTSDRKRMTVIVKMPDGKIKLFCKGADSILLPRLIESNLIQVT